MHRLPVKRMDVLRESLLLMNQRALARTVLPMLAPKHRRGAFPEGDKRKILELV